MKLFSKNYKISEFLPNLGNFHVWPNWNFDQITKFQPNYEILTKFLNFNKVLKFQQNFRISILFWNFKKNGILTKFQNVHQIWLINDCSCTNCKLIWKACAKTLLLNYDQARKVSNRGVKWRANSVAKKWKYAMKSFTLGDQRSMINLTQFEATIWAKHNTQHLSIQKLKMMTLF